MDDFKENVYFLKGEDVPATYKRGQIEKYCNNPLIEALQPIYDVSKVVRKLTKDVPFKESHRKKNDTLRLHLIYDLPRFVQPLEHHLRIEQGLSILIRDGYVDRNPLTVNGVRIRNEGADNVQRFMHALKNGDLNSQTVTLDNRSYKTSGGGLSVIGVSGMGKTTAINNILATMYPAQVIRHGQYKGYSLNTTQIVWMKLDCPSKGGIKAFCLQFFLILKQLVNDDHYDSFIKKGTVDTMIPVMAQMCATYMLGVLAIDEIQHLSGNEENEETMLNFFVTLKNMLGVPIVLIGTNKAWQMLSKEFRQLRRACEHFGVIFWDRMMLKKKDGLINNKVEEGIDWELFIGALWRYQWTRQPVELSEELSKAMYIHSQGVTDIAIKLFMITQWKAINQGSETITSELIKSVMENELRALEPIMLAYQTNDHQKLEAMKDLVFPVNFLDELLTQATANNAAKGIRKSTGRAKNDQPPHSVDLAYDAVKWLMEADITPNHAEKIVRSLLEKDKAILLPELKSLALQTYMKLKQKVESRRKADESKIKKQTNVEGADLTSDILEAGSS